MIAPILLLMAPKSISAQLIERLSISFYDCFQYVIAGDDANQLAMPYYRDAVDLLFLHQGHHLADRKILGYRHHLFGHGLFDISGGVFLKIIVKSYGVLQENNTVKLCEIKRDFKLSGFDHQILLGDDPHHVMVFIHHRHLPITEHTGGRFQGIYPIGIDEHRHP